MAYNDDDELCWYYNDNSTNGCSTAPTGATTFDYNDAGSLTSSTGGPLGGLNLDYNRLEQTSQIQQGSGDPEPMTYQGTTSDTRLTDGDLDMSYTKNGLAEQQDTSPGGDTDWFVTLPDGTLLAEITPADGGSYDERYYLTDNQQSVIATIDDGDGPLIRYLYDPYGNQIRTWTDPDSTAETDEGTENTTYGPPATDPNPYRFQSGYADAETGLLKYGTRYYWPAIGKWTQTDPTSTSVGGMSNEINSLSNPLHLNSYLALAADPVNRIDSSGRWDWPEFVTGAFETLVDATALVGFGQIALDVLGITAAGFTIAGFFWVAAAAIGVWGLYEVTESFL